ALAACTRSGDRAGVACVWRRVAWRTWFCYGFNLRLDRFSAVTTRRCFAIGAEGIRRYRRDRVGWHEENVSAPFAAGIDSTPADPGGPRISRLADDRGADG